MNRDVARVNRGAARLNREDFGRVSTSHAPRDRDQMSETWFQMPPQTPIGRRVARYFRHLGNGEAEPGSLAGSGQNDGTTGRDGSDALGRWRGS